MPQREVKIYPHPVNEMMYIESSAPLQIEILGALGQLMRKENLAKGLTAIDVSELDAGLYYLNYGSGLNQVKLRFLIVKI